MIFREILTVAIVAGGLAAAASSDCAAQTPLPPEPTLDAAGNYVHDADVTARVILISSDGVLIECTQPKSAAHPAAVWRERYGIKDGKEVLAAMITQRLVPSEAAHSEWQETTISHTPTPPERKPKGPQSSIGTDPNSGSTNIGSTGFDPRWSGFSPYLTKMTTVVQTEWDHIRITNKVYPKSGTAVTVKFVLDAKGNVTRIINVDTAPGTPEAASRTCVAAITAHAPYGEWTEEMVATLGADQEMSLTFYYP